MGSAARLAFNKEGDDKETEKHTLLFLASSWLALSLHKLCFLPPQSSLSRLKLLRKSLAEAQPGAPLSLHSVSTKRRPSFCGRCCREMLSKTFA